MAIDIATCYASGAKGRRQGNAQRNSDLAPSAACVKGCLAVLSCLLVYRFSIGKMVAMLCRLVIC